MGTIKKILSGWPIILVAFMLAVTLSGGEGMAQPAADPGTQVPPGPPVIPPGHDRHDAANEVGDIKWSFSRVDHGDWLLCDGRAVSRLGEAALFATIQVIFGVGDGVTTFNIPDCRGRSLLAENHVGLPGSVDVTRAIRLMGGIHGDETNTSALPLHSHLGGTLVAASVAPHSHGAGTLTAGGSPAHTHDLSGAGGTMTVFRQGEASDPDFNAITGRSTDISPSFILVTDAISLFGSTGSAGGGGGSVVGSTALTGLPPASVSGSSGLSGVPLPLEPNVHPVAVLGNVFVFAP